MKPRRIDEVLARMDRALNWTGMPARVAKDSADSPADRPGEPTRWMPLLFIAVSIGFVVLSLIHPSLLEVSISVMLPCLAPLVQRNGPLKGPSIDDDEFEASLRKNAWLFCFGVLAILNCLGQPLLAVSFQLRNWPIGHTAIVAGTIFNLNACLFGCLPTLYASWALYRAPQD